MPDYDNSRLDAEFADFRSAVAPHVRPPGINIVRQTVTHRRKVRVGTLVVLLVLAAVIPTSLAFAAWRDRPTPPSTGDPTPSSSPSESPTPSPSSSAAPPAMPLVLMPEQADCDNTKGLPKPPAGGIPLSDLCNATLNVPTWTGASTCPAGPTLFENGNHFIQSSYFLMIGIMRAEWGPGLAYVDIDQDGDAETIVLVSCGGQMWISQVIALDRDSTGAIRTIGRVVRTEQGAGIKQIYRIQPRADGTMRIDVGDFNPGVDAEGTISQRQWRTYGWNGVSFVQTAGPTTFPPNQHLADLTLSAGGLRFAEANGGRRTGTVKLTIRNLGPAAAPFTMTMSAPKWAILQAQPGCDYVSHQEAHTITCVGATLAAEESRSITLRFEADAEDATLEMEMVPTARVKVGDGFADVVYANSEASITISLD